VCRTPFITRFSTIRSILGASTGTMTDSVWTRIDRRSRTSRLSTVRFTMDARSEARTFGVTIPARAGRCRGDP
jgi:hypothetical protein